MGIVKIPEKTIITCDCCGLDKAENRKAFTMNATVKFNSEGLDYQGEAVGPGDNTTSIFCNSCYDALKWGLTKHMLGYRQEKEEKK